jgi:hypothetical protein
MSTLSVTTVNSANGTTDLTLKTGNNSGATIIIPANGAGISFTSIIANTISTNTITDSIGNVRTVPQNYQTSSYVLVSTDAGKYISITAGGVTVPGGSIFTFGQTITIYNNSGSNQTIIQGAGVTMFLVGTSTTGNRTLAQRGLATLLCVDTNTFVITGGGLS